MKIHNVEQNSLEWLTLRSGVVTASEFDNLLTPKFEVRKGQMVESYLARKVAEKWLGGPLPGHMTIEMEAGQIRQEEATPWLEFDRGLKVQIVGFITTDDGKVGCSPDGLIGDESGVEIKCCNADTHVKHLLAGAVPADYLTQIHGSMYVTGRKSWHFLSYRRRFPALFLVVNRDEEIQKIIHEAVTLFVARVDREYERLVKLNGGPPKRWAIDAAVRPTPAPESDDVPH